MNTGVRFVLGKMGSGKSLYCMARIVERLEGGRTVVTNMPVVLDGLARYLADRGSNVDLHRQLRLLREEELREFWRYRGWREGEGWVTLPPWDHASGKTDFALNPGPVDYFLEEVHQVYPARSWQSTGLGATWYTRQHRKFGDSVWFNTHSPGDVDKLLRVGVQEWIYLRNNRTENILGIFRSVPWFTFQRFSNIPGPASVPMQTGRFRLDVSGLCACYDTSAGVGVAGGGGADKGSRARGLPLWVLALPFFGLFWLVWWAPDAGARAMTKRYSGRYASPPGATSPVLSHVVSPSPLSVARVAPAVSSGVVEVASVATVTMCAQTPRGWLVGLSDGRVFSPGDPRVLGVYVDGVEIRGEGVLRLHGAQKRPEASVSGLGGLRGL